MFDDEPVEFRRDADDHATEDLDRRNIVRVDRSSTAGASSEEDVFILPSVTSRTAMRCSGATNGCVFGRFPLIGSWPCAVAQRMESTLHLMMRPGYTFIKISASSPGST